MRPLADAWVQTFGFLALVSGALAAYGRLSPQAGAGPAASAAAPARPGRILVDARLARDADTSDLAVGVASAKSGQTVYVRPGTYRGPLRPASGVRIVGLGSPEAVVIEGPGDKPTIEADGAALSISSVSLRGGSPVVWAHGGAQVTLEGVWIATGLSGVVATGPGTKVRLSRSHVLRSGGDGVHARDHAAVALERSELLGHKGCGLSLAQSASAALRGSTLSLNDYGVCADASSALDLGDADLGGNMRGRQTVRD